MIEYLIPIGEPVMNRSRDHKVHLPIRANTLGLVVGNRDLLTEEGKEIPRALVTLNKIISEEDSRQILGTIRDFMDHQAVRECWEPSMWFLTGEIARKVLMPPNTYELKPFGRLCDLRRYEKEKYGLNEARFDIGEYSEIDIFNPVIDERIVYKHIEKGAKVIKGSVLLNPEYGPKPRRQLEAIGFRFDEKVKKLTPINVYLGNIIRSK